MILVAIPLGGLFSSSDHSCKTTPFLFHEWKSIRLNSASTRLQYTGNMLSYTIT